MPKLAISFESLRAIPIRFVTEPFLFFIALTLALGVGFWGRNRRIGFGWAFAISLFNVILGLIVVLCSKKKKDVDFIEQKNKMKNFGLFCLILGCAAFLGSLLYNHSTSGPLFWIGLGLFLIHRANQKEKEEKNKENWNSK